MDDAEELTILSLCEGAASGQTEALRQFLEEHGPPLLNRIESLLAARGITYNRADMATDILQDVAVQLWERAVSGDLMEVRSLRSYVYGAARRHTMYCLRQGWMI